MGCNSLKGNLLSYGDLLDIHHPIILRYENLWGLPERNSDCNRVLMGVTQADRPGGDP